jgi:hypothetical protein
MLPITPCINISPECTVSFGKKHDLRIRKEAIESEGSDVFFYECWMSFFTVFQDEGSDLEILKRNQPRQQKAIFRLKIYGGR